VIHRLGALGVLAASAGCGAPRSEALEWEPIPREEAADELERTVCRLYEDCGCAIEPDCEGSIDIQSAFDVAQAARLDYDEECMGELVARYEAQGCAARGEDAELTCAEACKPLFGAVGAGQPCEYHISSVGPGFHVRVDDCDRYHECVGSVCVPRCWETDGAPPAGEGKSCAETTCEAGLWCYWETDVCEALPGPGDPCPGGECIDAWCDTAAELVCRELVAMNGECMGHFMCDTGYCPDGRCRARPEEGEECFGPCVEGLECIDEVCTPPPAAVCVVP
jgi:hypothetical protein